MRAELQFLYEKFNEFNANIFNNRLPAINIRIDHAGRRLGCLMTRNRNLTYRQAPQNYTIQISDRFDLPQPMLEDILIHEMIHFELAVEEVTDTSSHGRLFKQRMAEINRTHDRHVSVRSTLPKDIVRTDLRLQKMYFITCYIAAQHVRGYMRCATASIFRIYRQLQADKRVSDIRIFGTTDPFFNMMPNSRTIKIYELSDEYAARLEQGVELTITGNVLHPKDAATYS